MLESLINKFASLQYDLHFYYKGIPTQVFRVNIAKYLKTSILKEICERLLLNFIDSKWKK